MGTYDGTSACTGDLTTHRADQCDRILAELLELARMGASGTRLDNLLNRVSDLLDDFDQVLIVRNPVRDHKDFVLAARLHRLVDQVHVAISAHRDPGARPARRQERPMVNNRKSVSPIS